MGFDETEIPCPICGYFLTDVDGMLECENPNAKMWHVVFFSTDPEDQYFKDNGFNFEAYFNRPEERVSKEIVITIRPTRDQLKNLLMPQPSPEPLGITSSLS
jgi:hypothetical protein